MKSAEQRILHYLNRTGSSLIGIDLTAVLTEQQQNYASYCTEFVPLQMHAGQLLDSAGVSITERVFYQAYVSQVYAATKRFTGLSLLQAVAKLKNLYVTRGLTFNILNALTGDVFGYTLYEAYARATECLQPIANITGVSPVSVKCLVQNQGFPSDTIAVTCVVEKKTGGVYGIEFTGTLTTGSIASWATPSTATMSTNWTPSGAGTFRMGAKAKATTQVRPEMDYIFGPDFTVSVS